jgi:two-component system, chemotaxis family, CheB/CheR fusion protein
VLCVGCLYAPPSSASQRVLIAQDEHEALRLAREHNVDLVLLGTGPQDSFQRATSACRGLASDPSLEAIPILFLHGGDLDDDQLATLYEAGISKILSRSSSDRLVAASVGACLRATARHRAGERRQQQQTSRLESALELLMNTIPIGIAIADAPDGRVRSVSRYGAELLGWSRDELLGLPSREIATRWTFRKPDEPEPAADDDLPLVRALRRGEKITGEEWRLQAADGRDLMLLCNAAPLRDDRGEITGAVIVWTDISGPKREEAARREAEERLRLLLETIPDVAYQRNLSTQTYDFISPETQHVMGISADELRTMSTEQVIERIHPDDHQDIARALLEEEQRGRRIRVDYRFCANSGEYRWMSDHFSVQRDPSGAPRSRVGIVRDITQEKNAADQLRESRAFFSRIIELVPSILYIYDMEEGRNVWGNRELFSSLGYEPEQIAAMGSQLLRTLLHPEDWPVFERHRDRVFHLQNGEGAELEYRMRRADGTWGWFHSREMSFRRNAQGRTTQVVGVAHDITERRHAEQLLRDSEARYRTLFESNPLPMWLSDLDALRFLNVNEAAIAHYGYSRDEFLAMSLADIRPPEDVDKLLNRAREVSAGYEQHGVWRHLKKDGTPIDVELTANTMNIDGRRVALVLAHDVTERLRAERALRESEARFRLALDAAPVTVFEQDRELRYTWIHNAQLAFGSERVLGRTDEDLLGQEGAALIALKRRVLHSGRPWRGEVALNLPSGRRDYDLVVEPRTSAGEVNGIACAAIDISDRMSAARAMARANHELHRFTSIVSHDLKEPLRGVTLLAQFMLEDEHSLSAEGRARLKRIGELCDRLVDMIGGLLEYARSGGARRNETCDLNAIVRAAADKLNETVAQQQIELSIQGPLPTIVGDAVLLERLFANLIANAIKHNRAQVKRIWIDMEGDSISVRDNGRGIDSRHHQRIFDLFTRLPGAGGTDGIGLGLALVKNIVESHGGRITVRSEVGKGSTFLLHFPGAGRTGAAAEDRGS